MYFEEILSKNGTTVQRSSGIQQSQSNYIDIHDLDPENKKNKNSHDSKQ